MNSPLNFFARYFDQVCARFGFGMRAKLIALFVVIKVIPLILLAIFSWQQSWSLGKELRHKTEQLTSTATQALKETGEISIGDAVQALDARTKETLDGLFVQSVAALKKTQEEAHDAITRNLRETTFSLTVITGLMIIVVVLIAIWMASAFTRSITSLNAGLSRFRSGERHFRFRTPVKDELGSLADSFDELADNLEKSIKRPLSIVDLQRNVRYMNEAALRLVGASLPEIFGKPYAEHSLYPGDSPYCPIASLLQGREAEVLFHEPSGGYYKGTADFLTDHKTGEHIGYIVVSTDYTKLISEQQKHEKQRALMQAIFTASPDLMWFKDSKGRYLAANPRFESMLGKAQEDYIGHTLNELFPPEMAAHIAEADAVVAQIGLPLYTEDVLTFADGHTEVVEVVRTPVFNSAGEYQGILGVARDVTSRVKVARELRETQVALEQAGERTQIMLDATPLCANFWDRSFTNIDCNREAVKLFDLSSKQEYCDKYFELSPERQPCGALSSEKMIEHVAKAFENGHCRFEWMHQKLNGEPIPCEIILVRVQYKDDFIVAGYVRDLRELKEMISEMRRIDIAEASSKAKSNVLAMVSHEIRTPMNAILGMAELALRDEMPVAAREHTLAIKQAGDNLLTIINDILDFSKIEKGQLEIIPEEYLFASLAHDVISIIRTQVLDSRLRFVVNIDSDMPNALFGDAVRIRQVMLNLLSNAVKYTEKGFVSLVVTGKTVEDTVDLTIEVADSGSGIKEENLDKLFDEFTQFDLENNRNIEGTGLGLAIVRNLIKAMDGEIHVASEYGKGSVFTVTLPQRIRSREKLARVENPQAKNVLIFERREACINSIVRTMDDLGVTYKLVSTVSEFYDGLVSKQFSFVFVASTLYGKVKRMYAEFEPDAQIVLITEFGEVVVDKSISVLTTPIFSIPMANILNGVSDSFTRSVGDKFEARFIMPEARVLIVDDISINLRVAEGLMLPYAMRVDLCASGMEAIEAIKSSRYDLVFMDHMMPEMNGIEATLRIRALEGDESYYKSVPIVALTANAVSGANEMFLDNGFNDFLSKPIDMIKLNAILEKWIPKEKQKKPTEKSFAAKAQGAGEGIEIVDVDTDKGIAMSGGTVDRYLRTLAIYCEDSRKKIKEITACLENGDLPLYTIHVHALKSASANIGAFELSKTAAALELAGQQRDLDFIQTRNKTFLSDLETLLAALDEVLSAQGSKKQSEPIDMASLKAELSRLRAAMVDYDIAAINEAAKNLQVSTSAADIGDVIGKILQYKLVGEYDEAVLLIDAIVGYDSFREHDMGREPNEK